MAKILYISGFNGDKNIVSEEKKTKELLEKKGVFVDQLDYYHHYSKLNTQEIVRDITDKIVNAYYQDGEPVNIIAWSLGGSILVEVLNQIKIYNQMLATFKEQQIEVGRVIMFSPAWFISSPYTLIKSTFNYDFANEEAKRLNKMSETAAVKFVSLHPFCLYHLYNMSSFLKHKTKYFDSQEKDAESGLSVLSDFNVSCIVPENDSCINVSKTLSKLSELGIDTTVIGSYGHMSLLVDDVIDEMLKKYQKAVVKD